MAKKKRKADAPATEPESPLMASKAVMEREQGADVFPATVKQLEPAKEGNGHIQTHAEKVRRKEPSASYSGRNVRVTTDGDSWMVEVKNPLSAEVIDGVQQYVTTGQRERLTASGFDDVSDRGNGSAWMASAKAVMDIGTDVNILAVSLDAKGERLGRSR